MSIICFLRLFRIPEAPKFQCWAGCCAGGPSLLILSHFDDFWPLGEFCTPSGHTKEILGCRAVGKPGNAVISGKWQDSDGHETCIIINSIFTAKENFYSRFVTFNLPSSRGVCGLLSFNWKMPCRRTDVSSTSVGSASAWCVRPFISWPNLAAPARSEGIEKEDGGDS